MTKKDLIEVRSEYCRLIRQELLGPGSEVSIPDADHEIITSQPYQRYSIGILYPQNAEMTDDDGQEEHPLSGQEELEPPLLNDSDEQPSFESEEDSCPSSSASGELLSNEDGNLDDEVELSTQQLPSSFGISFISASQLERLEFELEFATYRKAEPHEYKYPKTRDYDKNLFVTNGASRILIEVNSDGRSYFEFAQTVSDEDAQMVLSTIKNQVNDTKSREPTDENRKLLDELYWQYDIIGKARSFLLRPGNIRVPYKDVVRLDFNDNYIRKRLVINGITLSLTALKRNMKGARTAVTAMLVNEESGHPSCENCVFQPRITISSNLNSCLRFVPLQAETDFASLDDEEKTLDLQYRNKKTYASGLGVSAEWKVAEDGAGAIWTEYIPLAEVPAMDFNIPSDSGIDEKCLSMRYLSDMDETTWAEKSTSLSTLCSAYKTWIEKIEAVPLEERYSSAAKSLIGKCKESHQRMLTGLSILESNEAAQKAFLLANRAMYMQRFHVRLQESFSGKDRFNQDEELSEALNELRFERYKDASSYNFQSNVLQRVAREKFNWRLFQIAFLLVSIAGIADDKSPDRDIVDLIWFPTGGGKTEAYLGLTAFTIFYRRLSHPGHSGGTTVIMRYTLRLLAAQQFTRAATLICACENIRRNLSSCNLGDEEISIGLWIGGEHTPNRVTGDRSAQYFYGKLTGQGRNSSVTVHNLEAIKERFYKFQLLKCPWCGTKMVKEVRQADETRQVVGDWGCNILSRPTRFRFHCPQEDCAYYDELPIQVVDEELYAKPPTLLFATVDKFAMMAWKSKIRSFFAAAAQCQNRSPELIIQDELHLISGPLGTMVAMYETAIDELCSKGGVKPKIVASTATIRRAISQCGALYNREVRQFPSPGINAEDSFFSRESKVDHDSGIFGRLYVGLMPSGKTKATMQVRAISALMQKIKDMPLDDAVKDRFWTLTAYFNSLKDLGKCSTLVCDDVKDSIRFMKGRLSTRFSARNYTLPDELTSRVTTTELNRTLDKLEKNSYSSSGYESKKRPSDIVLATNMISVGIDVARLNVMLMVGQPKLTSEYIQASSRVGRSDPGVVFVQYDSAKSRDRSHYEQFKSYHDGFYRYVEPTGATPFSRPAIDRAIHAILVSLLRAKAEAYSDDPNSINQEDLVVKGSLNIILNRMREVLKKISPSSMLDEDVDAFVHEEIGYAEDALQRFLDIWENMHDESIKTKADFNYGEKYLVTDPEENNMRLLKQFGKKSHDDAYDTLTSMRNVDASVHGSLIIEQ